MSENTGIGKRSACGYNENIVSLFAPPIKGSLFYLSERIPVPGSTFSPAADDEDRRDGAEL